jgi:hypothetical protein
MSLYKSTHARLGDKMRGSHAGFPWLLSAFVATRLAGTGSETSHLRRVVRPIWTAAPVDASCDAERRAPNRLCATPTSLPSSGI